MADWFADNAPAAGKPVLATPPLGAPGASGGDWFAQNAPDAPDAASTEPTFKIENQKDAAGNATVDPSAIPKLRAASPWLAKLYQENGPDAFVAGIHHILGGEVAKGTNEAVRGAGVSLMPMALPALLTAAATAPVATAATMAAGAGAQAVGSQAGQAMGLTPDQSELLGTAASIPGAMGGAKLGKMASEGLAAMRAPAALTPEQSRVRDAVTFARNRGVPMDAATVSDNRAVRGAQQLADNLLGGAGTAAAANAEQAAGMQRLGGELADETRPGKWAGGGAISPEQAGSDVNQALVKKAAGHAADADRSYDALRAFEAAAPEETRPVGKAPVAPRQSAGFAPSAPTPAPAPTRSMKLATDIKSAKADAGPLYNALLRESEITQLTGDKAKALVNLDRLMKAPDFAPLSDVDQALSSLKSTQEAIKGTPGGRALASVIARLDGQVKDVARAAGPDVLDALMEGRRSTVAKYETQGVLESVFGPNADREPVRVIDALTRPKDASIQALRAVAQQVPEQVPSIARAFLEDVFAGKRQVADWQALGAETKQTLFPKTADSLDKFFTVMDRINKKGPNTSGSATSVAIAHQVQNLLTAVGAGVGALTEGTPGAAVGAIAGAGAPTLAARVVSGMARSPRVIDALTAVAKVPTSAPLPVRSVAINGLLQALRSETKAAVPVAARIRTPDQSSQAPGATGRSGAW